MTAKSTDFYLRAFLENSYGKSIALASAGVVIPQNPIVVTGSNSFTASVQGIASDVFRIEGRIGTEAFYIVQNTMNANQHYTFTGPYDELRLVKVSGSGTTAAIVLKYMRI